MFATVAMSAPASKRADTNVLHNLVAPNIDVEFRYTDENGRKSLKNTNIYTIVLILFSFVLVSCEPTIEDIQTAVAQTQKAWTPVPSQTPYPTQTIFLTYTPHPTIVVTKLVTPTTQYIGSLCKPITNMDYSNNSKVAIKLQSYVSELPGVRSVSYVIPEKLYSNTLSQLYYVTYVDDEDGEVYSKRYIVYMNKFKWKRGTFSIDGQCWIDSPH